MLTDEIREFLASRPRAAPGPDSPFELEELAAAALMVECARIDGEFGDQERNAIYRAVREDLAIDEETAECLAATAESRFDAVWHDWLFTEIVKTTFDEAERLAVIRKLWEVALADGTVHPFEERLIARIASGLGVSEEAVAAGRERARRGRAAGTRRRA